MTIDCGAILIFMLDVPIFPVIREYGKIETGRKDNNNSHHAQISP